MTASCHAPHEASTLLDVIPTGASLVRESHGRVDPKLGWDGILVADAGVDGRVSCPAVHDLAIASMSA